MNQTLIDTVLKQIQDDVDAGILAPLEELLRSVPVEDLKAYLPEEIVNA